jgi:hypothetical protein
MKDFPFRQGLLTVCNFYKTLLAPVSYDLSTITQVNEKSQTNDYRTLIEDISDHFKDFLKARSIDSFSLKSDNPVFATPKASANGRNALGATSLLDAMASSESNLSEVQFKIAETVFTESAFKKYTKLYEDSLSLFPTSFKKSKLRTGRLHFLQEGGGKTRVICIPDI